MFLKSPRLLFPPMLVPMYLNLQLLILLAIILIQILLVVVSASASTHIVATSFTTCNSHTPAYSSAPNHVPTLSPFAVLLQVPPTIMISPPDPICSNTPRPARPRPAPAHAPPHAPPFTLHPFLLPLLLLLLHLLLLLFIRCIVLLLLVLL